MIDKTHPIDPKPWRYAEKAPAWYGLASPIGLGLFLVAVGVAALAALLALLHVTEVIP
jgi:hypothetical protein